MSQSSGRYDKSSLPLIKGMLSTAFRFVDDKERLELTRRLLNSCRTRVDIEVDDADAYPAVSRC